MTQPSDAAGSLRRERSMMNIDDFIARQEHVPDIPLTIPAAELLARYEQLYSGAISDVLREFCLVDQALPHTIQSLRLEQRSAAGIAFTVKSAPNTRITGEMEYRSEMLNAMHEHAFVVWDASGDSRSTQWGGVMTAAAIGKGVRGAAIDGGIRDTSQILERDFPVFHRYRSPNAGLGRSMITNYQIPLRIGDVFIRPGDIVLGDLDGVVVVPRHLAVDVLLRAEEVCGNEVKIFEWVARGDSIDDIEARGGYF